MKVGSLFSGIGGFELGLQMASPDFEIAWQVEQDEFCQQVLAKHWPDARRWDDVKTFPPDPVEDWAVDLICGGWPCQPVSIGSAKREGFRDERWLWPEFCRILSVLRPRPRWFLGENVTGILSAVDAMGRRGGLFGGVLRDLAALGYRVEYHCIPAAALGAKHKRDRVWLIGKLADARSESTRLEEHRRSGQKRKTPNAPKPEVLRPEDRSPGSKRVGADGQDVSDADCRKLEARGDDVRVGRQWVTVDDLASARNRTVWSSECRLGLHADGISSGLGECRGWECGIPRVIPEQPNRLRRITKLHALGNSVVPQIPEMLGRVVLREDNR